MSTSHSLLEGVIVMLAIISLAAFLRKISVLKKDDSLLFSKIVMKVTLPALIFSSLAISDFHADFLRMALIMCIIEITIILLAWLTAHLLKFDRGKTGALILASAFGMTTMLGYPLIREVFNNNPVSIEEAVVTSEFGVGFLLFIVGPLIAMYFGESTVNRKDIGQSAARFFISPVFISLVAGILFSFLKIDHENEVSATFLRFFKLIGNANLLMVTFTIGLLIEYKSGQNVFLFLVLALIMKLILKPLLAIWWTDNGGFTDMMRQIVIIETALPSAILGVVFARRYNCRPDLVSLAIMASLVLSVITVNLIFLLVA